MECSAGHSTLPPAWPAVPAAPAARRGDREGSAFVFLICLFALIWQQAKSSSLAKFITIVKCSQLHPVEHATVRRKEKHEVYN